MIKKRKMCKKNNNTLLFDSHFKTLTDNILYRVRAAYNGGAREATAQGWQIL